jgi:hypothetical protein
VNILDRPDFNKLINSPVFRDQITLPNSHKTLDWCTMDSKELFDKNLKTDPDNRHLKYYLKNPVTYRFNKHGYRTDDEFDNTTAGNVYLGCSHTFGIGHSIENTWSYLTNKNIDGSFYNLSTPGTGSGTALRTLLYWYGKLNVKRIFHFAPLYPRYEFNIKGRYTTIDYTHNKFNTGDLKHTFADDTHIELYTLTNILAIQAIANKINVPYYVITDEEAHNRYEPIHNDDLPENILARDLIHYSNTKQKLFSELFLEKLNTNI